MTFGRYWHFYVTIIVFSLPTFLRFYFKRFIIWMIFSIRIKKRNSFKLYQTPFIFFSYTEIIFFKFVCNYFFKVNKFFYLNFSWSKKNKHKNINRNKQTTNKNKNNRSKKNKLIFLFLCFLFVYCISHNAQINKFLKFGGPDIFFCAPFM